eukprot:s3207_g12.t1
MSNGAVTRHAPYLKENEALRASVEAAYVYNPVMPMGNPMVLPAPVLMPMEFQGVDSNVQGCWSDTAEEWDWCAMMCYAMDKGSGRCQCMFKG